MLIGIARRLARCCLRLEVVLARFNMAKPLRHRLSQFDDEILDNALSDAGLERAALFTALKSNARHRKRMAAMMTRFRVDKDRACETDWPALREADAICADCPKAGRCMRLLEWGSHDDSLRRICPNAPLFDRIAFEQGLAQRPSR